MKHLIGIFFLWLSVDICPAWDRNFFVNISIQSKQDIEIYKAIGALKSHVISILMGGDSYDEHIVICFQILLDPFFYHSPF